jgi:predicted enzyme related to lactoylglutathione lyase
MAYRSAFPMLICDDLARSIAFYCDALGVTKRIAFVADPDGNPVMITAPA